MELAIDLGGVPSGTRLGVGDPPADLAIAVALIDMPGVVVVAGDAADTLARAGIASIGARRTLLVHQTCSGEAEVRRDSGDNS